MSVAEVTGRRGDAVDLVEVGRQPLDERLLAERDDAGDVAVGDHLEGLAQERQRVLAAVVADRIGQVDDEDRRQPVDRQDEPEAGQGEDEGGQQDGPDDERDAPPADAHPPARAQVQPDRQGQGRDEQEQRERARRRRCPSGGAARVPPEPRRERASEADQGVAVVERPLDAQDSRG